VSNQFSLNLDSSETKLDQFTGAFVGAAIGDALGFITEFARDKRYINTQFKKERLTDLTKWERITNITANSKKYPIKLPIPEGTYSDDTQLTLATARALQADGTFDIEAFSKLELPLWAHYELGGGVGSQIAASHISKKTISWYSNFFETSYSQYVNGGGNGAAMRILPIATANMNDTSRSYQNIWRNAIVTHGHPRGIMGAILFSDALQLLINNQSLNKSEWLQALTKLCQEDYLHITKIWQEIPEYSTWATQWEQKAKRPFKDAWLEVCEETSQYLALIHPRAEEQNISTMLNELGCYDRRTKGAGHTTVIAALLFVTHSKSFEEALILVANEIGIDTDTIGYFTGALWGAQSGINAIPENFKQKIQDFSYLLKLSNWCYQIYTGNAKAQEQFSYPDAQVVQIPTKIEELLGQVSTINTPIHFPVLGSGKLTKNTDVTPGWTNNHYYFLEISMEMGQTLYFHLLRPLTASQVVYQQNLKGEQAIISSLSVLDQYKTRVEKSGFSPSAILESLHEIKFNKRDRALYNAFSSWLWAALPQSPTSPHMIRE
jgi:ADP-ribosylglycohydrolase